MVCNRLHPLLHTFSIKTNEPCETSHTITEELCRAAVKQDLHLHCIAIKLSSFTTENNKVKCA